MRIFVFILAAMPGAGQPLGVQFKAGIPLTDYYNSDYLVRAGFARAWTNRYVIGPAVEFRLPRRFSIEIEALYQRVHMAGFVIQVGVPDTYAANAKGGAWQFPLMATFHLMRGPAAPFVSGGPSVQWIRFSGETHVTTLLPTAVSSTPRIHESNARIGIATGGGVDFKAGRMRVTPEIRYSFYGSGIDCASCLAANGFHGWNSVSVMLGVGF